MTRTNSKGPDWLDPRQLAELEGLRVQSRHLIDGLIAGWHRNPRVGRSIEFSQHREYVPGDELRHVDWRAFARTDKMHVKHFEDETNVRAWLILDQSRSMEYAGDPRGLSKWQYAQLVAVGLSWIILQQRDAVGMAMVDARVRSFLPASSERIRLDNIVDIVDKTQCSGETRIASGLLDLAHRLPRRGIVFLISDCLDDIPRLSDALQRLSVYEHDLRVVHVIDPCEASFPFSRTTRFSGLEDQQSLVADGVRLRSAYLAEFQSHVKALTAACRQRQIRYVDCQTDVPFDSALTRIVTPSK